MKRSGCIDNLRELRVLAHHHRYGDVKGPKIPYETLLPLILLCMPSRVGRSQVSLSQRGCVRYRPLEVSEPNLHR